MAGRPEFSLCSALSGSNEQQTCPGPSLSSAAVWQHSLFRCFSAGAGLVCSSVFRFYGKWGWLCPRVVGLVLGVSSSQAPLFLCAG